MASLIPEPGTDEFYTMPADVRATMWEQAIQQKSNPVAGDYFTEPELQFLGAQWGAGNQPGQGSVPAPIPPPPSYGGGGGGTVFVGGGQPTAPQRPRNIAEAETYIREHYGFMAWALDIPEVRMILVAAALEGWDATRVQGEIQKTNWWKTTTQQSREFDALYATDPSTAWQMIAQGLEHVKTMLSTLGVEVSDTRLAELTEKAVKWGWDDTQIQRAVLAEARYTGDPDGQLGEAWSRTKALAKQFGYNASDEGAFYLSRKLLMGDMDEAGLTDWFRDKAKKLYPHLAGDLDVSTVAELAEPFMQTAAQLLEKSPRSLDISDPLYRRALHTRGEDGKLRMMDLDEWQSTLMNDSRYGWDRTSNAKQAALGIVGQLGEMFGRVA